MFLLAQGSGFRITTTITITRIRMSGLISERFWQYTPCHLAKNKLFKRALVTIVKVTNKTEA